ncbi:MAG: hypothetical protein EBR93_03840 [Bacteroidetes bacterium]|nr:hypothetical protein [Bacteroidota bacterium]
MRILLLMISQLLQSHHQQSQLVLLRVLRKRRPHLGGISRIPEGLTLQREVFFGVPRMDLQTEQVRNFRKPAPLGPEHLRKM